MRTYLLRHQPPMRRDGRPTGQLGGDPFGDGQPTGGAAAILPDAAPA